MNFRKIITMEKGRRYLVFGGLAIVAILGSAAGLYLHGLSDKPEANTQIAKAQMERISGQAGGQGSAEYNDKLQKHDDEQAMAALKGGESFVPTPVGVKHPVVGKKESTPPPAPKVAKVKTAPVQKPKPDTANYKRMLEDLEALDAKLASATSGTGQIVYQKDFPKEQAQEAQQAVPASASHPVDPKTDLKPGDLLYAVIDTGVNSDVPSAVMATVAQGKYRNSRLLGSFQRHDERMVLAFTRAILPTGSSVQLEAYAIDPNTSEASVASSVDTHFFSRWGGLVASAFLEGLGSAKRYSGASSTMYGYGNNASDQMVWGNYSPEDQAWIAAGKVGEKASKIFEKNFDRPPTVRLESGTAVGILIINVKEKGEAK
ncbi:MAG: DotG/IcmE/VirB10 family protein [Desulfovibrio sp.]